MVIDNSCATFVIFMDGDMVFPPDLVQKQVELMEKNPEIGVAQGTNDKVEKTVVQLQNSKIYLFQALLRISIS